MILPDDNNDSYDIANEDLKRLLETIIHDLGNASTILLLQQRINLSHRLLEISIQVSQVFEEVKGGQQ